MTTPAEDRPPVGHDPDGTPIAPMTIGQLGLCGPRSDDPGVGPDAARHTPDADDQAAPTDNFEWLRSLGQPGLDHQGVAPELRRLFVEFDRRGEYVRALADHVKSWSEQSRRHQDRASALSGLLRGMARRATQQRRLRKSRFDALVAAVAALNKARAIADGQSGLAEAWRQDVYRLNQRLAAVRALADEMDPPKCPEHISFVGKQPDCAACEAWWASSPAREARGMQLRAVLDGPTEAAEPRLRPCKLAASSCADPGCTVCYVPPATRAEAAEPTAFTAAARAVLAEWSRMHPSGYLAMYPAMDTLRTALAGSVPVAPALIGTWADPGFVAHQDHRHPVDGCGYCPEEG